MSIIIVGNGTSITDNKNGHKIDSFDTVLRFNSFKIQGYEEYTGTKTNIWFTVNRAHIKNINDFDEVIVHSWQWNKDLCKIYKELSSLRECDKTEQNFVRGKIPLASPSTGIMAIYMMLERYDKVCITGFDWWDRKKHHYGDNEARGTMHKPQEEYKVIQGLIKQNKVYFLR